MSQKAFCLLINAALPFVPGNVPLPLPIPLGKCGESGPAVSSNNPCWTSAEIRLFEEINENLVPLLWTFERLEQDNVPFKMALVLSPLLCAALDNREVIARYLKYLDRQIAFGKKENTRSANSKPLTVLVNAYIERFVRIQKYLEKKNGDILEIFRHFNRKGNLELLASPATDAYLPFYTAYPEVIRAQLSVSLSSAKRLLSDMPAGLWLTGMAYSPNLDDLILDHNFNYTVVDTHGLLLAEPPAAAGSFYPARTKKGLVVFARDFHLSKALRDMSEDTGGDCYRDNTRDAGYELPRELVEGFCGAKGERNPTGYKYWFRSQQGGCIQGVYYHPEKARDAAEAAAKEYVSACATHLAHASAELGDGKRPFSLVTVDIDTFGRDWIEGSWFLESFFREIHAQKEVELTTPSAFLSKESIVSFEKVTPLYSSCGTMGYAETVLDSSNDWTYRHLFRAIERMLEIAERFNDSGIRERLLNQAVRELLLSQSALWAVMLSDGSKTAVAKAHIEEHLKNFTAIYESLGHNFMSAKWLAVLEERDYVFPELNYRLFKNRDKTPRQGSL